MPKAFIQKHAQHFTVLYVELSSYSHETYNTIIQLLKGSMSNDSCQIIKMISDF